MKIYYIDDTMFQTTAFANEMRFRFIRLMKRNSTKLILVSVSDPKNQELHTFMSEHQEITVLVSPALFEIGSIRGNLRTAYLALEGYPSMQSYAGSCVEFDTEEHTCQRMYVDLFAKHHEESASYDVLVEELEQMIKESVTDLKKKSVLH